MKALITGANGQLGRALQATAPKGWECVASDVDTLDITDPAAVQAWVETERPDFLFNAAAYTAVDKAEGEEATAQAVNADAVALLAAAARGAGAKFIHVSTDFVFDGESATAYAPDAPRNPLSAYGRTKAAGEDAAGPDALIVRTAWVYAAGGANFVRTMIRLMRERESLRVVVDQIGAPTWATGLANTLWGLALKGETGLFHHSDAGVASWYDFAVAIGEEAAALGLIAKAVPIEPIPSSAYPTPARRPTFSLLDSSATRAALGEAYVHWRTNLRIMLKEEAALG